MKLIGILTLYLLAISTPSAAKGAANEQLETTPSVDLERYAGRWYEIARLPNRFQDDCAGDVSADYTLREDGRLDVVNACVKKSGEREEAAGVARLADEGGPSSKLKVRFAPWWLSWLPFVWGDYWIIELDPDYRFAVVGTPDRKYLWVLSRTPRMDEAGYQGAVVRAASRGFDVSRLIRTKQRGED